jgi:antitoxin (DNA-binding transcriptional repressor) of toxin-antitoxin stability system
MTIITSLDLRNNYQDIGQKAALGQSFTVTYRGNVLFDIVPSNSKPVATKPKKIMLYGFWTK